MNTSRRKAKSNRPLARSSSTLDSISGLSHNLLRSDNLERYITKLEETLTLKGVTLKASGNEVIDALFRNNGLITADQDVFLLSRLYCARAKTLHGLQHLAIVDASFDRYFTFDDFCSEMRRSCVQPGAALPLAALSGLMAFDLIAKLRRISSNKKPLCVIFLRLEDRQAPAPAEGEALLDFVRTTFLTAETRVVALRSQREHVPEELLKLLSEITPGGYFS